MQLLAKMLEIVLTPKIWRSPKIGGPRLKPFQPNGKSAPVTRELGFGNVHRLCELFQHLSLMLKT